MGKSHNTSRKFAHPPISHQIFIPLPNVNHSSPLNKNLKIFILQPNKNFIFSGSHCSCTIFVSMSYPLHMQVILILILSVGVHKKGSKFQNNSSLGSHQLQKKSSQAEPLILTPPPSPPPHTHTHTGEGISLHPLMLFWKTLLFG